MIVGRDFSFKTVLISKAVYLYFIAFHMSPFQG